MAERVLRVSILGDSRDLEKAFKTSSRSAKQFGNDMGQAQTATERTRAGFIGFGKAAAGAASGFFAAKGLLDGIQTAIDASSNLNEQTSKSRAVFGQQSAAIEAWARTTSRAFGIANDQALESAGSFGNLFRTLDVGEEDAAQMSRTLVELAADLAAFNNIRDPGEVLIALRAGLIGEAEPARRLGIRLSETRVQMEAMAQTGKRTVKALTDQEKVAARYAIILEDSELAQGNFAATSDDLAQKTKILRAELRDNAATLGNQLVPALNAATTAALGLIQSGKDLAGPSNPFFRAGEKAAVAWEAFGKAVGFVDDEAEITEAALKRIEEQANRTAAAGLGMAAALQEALRLRRDRFDLSEGFEPEPPPAPPRRATAEQRNDWFDAMIGRQLDRAQDVRTLQGQVQALEQIADLIRQRLAITKDITRKLTLEDELRSVTRQQRALRDQIASNKLATAELAADRERQRIEEARLEAIERAARAAAARATRQFRALGLGPGGAELIPNAESLRKRLGSVTQSVKGTILDTSATRGMLARIRRVLVTGGFGKIADDVRATIDGMLDDISDKLRDFDKGGELIKGRKANANALLQGLGLDPAEIKALRGRLSQIGVGGTVPVRSLSAFGMPAGGTQISWSINLDGQPLEANVTRRQGTRKRRNPKQKRGTSAAI